MEVFSGVIIIIRQSHLTHPRGKQNTATPHTSHSILQITCFDISHINLHTIMYLIGASILIQVNSELLTVLGRD